MLIDNGLVVKANKLDGRHIHNVNNLLAIYLGGIESGKPEHLTAARGAERKLRALIFEQELERVYELKKMLDFL